MNFIEEIRIKAKKKAGRICLPETEDERTIDAVKILVDENLVSAIYLCGDKESVKKKLSSKNIESDKIEIVDYKIDEKYSEYAEKYFEKRKHKGMTLEKAEEIMKNGLYYAAMMLAESRVDAVVAGAQNTTGDVLRAALHCVGLADGVKTLSSVFIMITDKKEYGKDGMLVFGDCAVVPDPTSEQLADIAESSAITTKNLLGIEPKVALMSFATKGSAKHERNDKVVEAVKILKERSVSFEFDGELQADAALVKKVGEKKAPDSTVAGNANCLIFPSLEAGNIGYKLVQRLAGAEAIGPVIQGLKRPYNDLSRGCSVDDIVNTVCLAILNS